MQQSHFISPAAGCASFSSQACRARASRSLSGCSRTPATTASTTCRPGSCSKSARFSKHRAYQCRAVGRLAQRSVPRRRARHHRRRCVTPGRRARPLSDGFKLRARATILGDAKPTSDVAARSPPECRGNADRVDRTGARTAGSAGRSRARDRHQRYASQHVAPVGSRVHWHPACGTRARVRVIRIQARRPGGRRFRVRRAQPAESALRPACCGR